MCDASGKHDKWGECLKMDTKPWVRARATKAYWKGLEPASGRPYAPALSEPGEWEMTQGHDMLTQHKEETSKEEMEKVFKTAFHNYVYVELASIDNPNNNIIFSNNPNAVRALFTASITNIDDIDNDYIVMDGDDMTQTIRFRIDTNFKFRVSMPNGQTFETTLSDNFSPLEPNPKLQIRALFQLIPIEFE